MHQQAVANPWVIRPHDQYAQSQSEVTAYERHVGALVTYHHVGAAAIDWQAILDAPPPPAPPLKHDMESAAVAKLNGFHPNLVDRLLSRSEAKRAALQQSVVNARNWDVKINEDTQQVHAAAYTHWQTSRRFAQGMVERNPAYYVPALGGQKVMTCFESLGTCVVVDVVEPSLISFQVSTKIEILVPQIELKITNAGNLSKKDLSKGRYWALLQDHLCSCAIRLACDGFSLLPVDRVIVNLGEQRINTTTGHSELMTLLAVHFTRRALSTINVYQIDPSDSMANFNCRMNFNKTKGFSPVEPIEPEDQWVTAG